MKLEANHLALFESIQTRGCGRICNDLEPEEKNLLSKSEWKEFCKNYHAWNGDPEIFEERTNYVLMDFMVVGYIQHLLLESYKKHNGN